MWRVSSMPGALVTGLGLVGVLGVGGTAEARPGIVGFSGRPLNGSSDTCTACHTDSTDPPRLDITAPATIAAGTTGQITVVVAGSRVRTSLNASFPDGVSAIAGTDTQVPMPLEVPNEVAAVTPPPSGATGTYTFGFVAPATNGPLMLWVAAVSANGNGAPTGDGVAATARTITVFGGTDAPATSPATVPGAGASSSPTPVHAIDPFGGGASSPSASSTTQGPLPAPGEPSSTTEAASATNGPAACAASPSRRRDGPALLLVLAALAALFFHARRRASSAMGVLAFVIATLGVSRVALAQEALVSDGQTTIDGPGTDPVAPTPPSLVTRTSSVDTIQGVVQARAQTAAALARLEQAFIMVMKPLTVDSGLTRPAFDQFGLGMQYRTPVGLQALVDRGVLLELQ
jgi:hypothetical protein